MGIPVPGIGSRDLVQISSGNLTQGILSRDLSRGMWHWDLTQGSCVGMWPGALAWGISYRGPTWEDLPGGSCTGEHHRGSCLGDLALGMSHRDLAWRSPMGIWHWEFYSGVRHWDLALGISLRDVTWRSPVEIWQWDLTLGILHWDLVLGSHMVVPH